MCPRARGVIIIDHHRNPVASRACVQASGSQWEEECDFVGHSDPVVCTSFNPRVFRRVPKDGQATASAPYTCCALGGQDAVLSLWVTASAKPLVVVRKIFEQDVLDIAWAPDGCVTESLSPGPMESKSPTEANPSPTRCSCGHVCTGTLCLRAPWMAPSPPCA